MYLSHCGLNFGIYILLLQVKELTVDRLNRLNQSRQLGNISIRFLHGKNASDSRQRACRLPFGLQILRLGSERRQQRLRVVIDGFLILEECKNISHVFAQV